MVKKESVVERKTFEKTEDVVLESFSKMEEKQEVLNEKNLQEISEA